jgi:hypothetical protein
VSKIEAASFFDRPYAPAILIGAMILCVLGGAVALSRAGIGASFFPTPG